MSKNPEKHLPKNDSRREALSGLRGFVFEFNA
jgi:hypothetical protein